MQKSIVLEKYPNLKLGFTTANFAKVLPSTAANIKELINFASDNHFSFIEIRDVRAILTLEECSDIAAYAARKEIEIVYAMGCGLLDPDFWDVFYRGIENAEALGGLKIARTLTTGKEMQNDPDKKYWDAAEFSKIVSVANKAADTAKLLGLQFVVENAREGLQGDGIHTFGTTEFFGSAGVNAHVGWQMDVGNFFCATRAPGTPSEIRKFVATNIHKVAYTHIKSTANAKAKAMLDNHEMPFEIFLDLMGENNKNYLAIELLQIEDMAEIQSNHIKSIEYLQHAFSRRAVELDCKV